MPDVKPDEIAIFAAASELTGDAQAAFLSGCRSFIRWD
jgi:hypothetical protein